jgi:8-oxo-dGTP pyrophosphatase MutT (NUDIX family)
MAQKYRIYINAHTLFIADGVPKQLEKIQQLDTQNFDFPTFYKNLVKGSPKQYILVTGQPKALFASIKKQCQLIKAAGGLVTNAQGGFLFIFRNKKWDLPKGKVEKGERIKTAAVREVEEECGIKIAKKSRKLCKTYHVYELDSKIVLKRTSWYSMEVKGVPKLVPQKEEGITRAVWVAPTAIQTKITNTYPLIFDVLKAGKLV